MTCMGEFLVSENLPNKKNKIMAKNLYSPSMLKSFLNCKYIIFNEINEKALKLVRKEKGFSDLKLLEKSFK